MVSAKHLGDDERVVLVLRRHAKSLVIPALVFLSVCAAVGFLAALVPGGDRGFWLQLGIAAVAVPVLARWVLWPFLGWLTGTYVVTNERILTQHGVVRRHGRTMALTRVNDVAYDRGLLDRLLGCGTLVVSSAGDPGQLVLADVPGVRRVQRTLYQLVEAQHGRERATARDAGPWSL